MPRNSDHPFGGEFIVQSLVKIKLPRILDVNGASPDQTVRVGAVLHLNRRIGRINHSFESAAVLENDTVRGIGKNGKIQR